MGSKSLFPGVSGPERPINPGCHLEPAQPRAVTTPRASRKPQRDAKTRTRGWVLQLGSNFSGATQISNS